MSVTPIPMAIPMGDAIEKIATASNLILILSCVCAMVKPSDKAMMPWNKVLEFTGH